MSYDDLTGEEFIDVIKDAMKEDGRVRVDFVEFEMNKGRPVLAGRVASDEDLLIVDEIMTDTLEIDDYDNNIWVDDSLSFEARDDDEEETEDLNFDEASDMDEESFDEDEEEK
ncbi:MAG TPA: hypothetical protein DDW49_08170 [Deltaproteobacteria bacterium]|nr:MAG: hypothetical protein A2048_07785 [Deltaproteobacteria bacterium GWA2_45_12]HBF13339.1 hypothetical protein [Deltaproteobacteria bacterium]